ncbi:MAG: hypothetical protein V8Q43_00030 [Christensenellaceae bacterium]
MRSVYIGGGTPIALCSQNSCGRVLQAVAPYAKGVEFTRGSRAAGYHHP